MPTLIRRFVRSPLTAFVLLGGLLFLIDLAVVGDSGDDRTIVVTAEIRDELQRSFVQQHDRPPSEVELDGLVQRWVEREALVREARALGLDRRDPIVRRRLAAKMELAVADGARVVDPTDDELKHWLGQRGDQPTLPAAVTLHHVYLHRDDDADQVRSALEQGAVPEQLGRPFVYGRRFVYATDDELRQVFGAAFVERLAECRVGVWCGPVASARGKHLVFVESRRAEGPATLADIRPQVLVSWRREQQERRRRELIEDIVGRFDVADSAGRVR